MGRRNRPGQTAQSRNTSVKKEEIVVFIIRRESTCAECGEVLGKGRFLQLEEGRPLCLACADLLGRGFQREEARELVSGDTERRLFEWQNPPGGE
jgi:hypothetical protein